MMRLRSYVIIYAVLILAMICSIAFADDDNDNDLSEDAAISKVMKNQKRTHYIDFDRAACFVSAIGERWTLRCEYRGRGPILKAFECPERPTMTCPSCKKWKKKLHRCKRDLKKMKRKKQPKIIIRKDPFAYDNGFSSGDRSPGHGRDN